MVDEAVTSTNINEYIRRERLKAWIYSGVEIELEMAKWDVENKRYLQIIDDETAPEYEKSTARENLKYNKALITDAFSQLSLVNRRIVELSL